MSPTKADSADVRLVLSNVDLWNYTGNEIQYQQPVVEACSYDTCGMIDHEWYVKQTCWNISLHEISVLPPDNSTGLEY